MQMWSTDSMLAGVPTSRRRRDGDLRYVHWRNRSGNGDHPLVAASFPVIRRRYPNLPRPYRTSAPRVVGWLAIATTVLFVLPYFPPSPSSLVWPEEWAIVLAWGGLGVVFGLELRRGAVGLGDGQSRRVLGRCVDDLVFR